MIRYAFLWLFHFILNVSRFFSSLRPRRKPQPLRSQRRKLPAHLAVLLGDYYGEARRKEVTSSNAELEDSLESVRRLVKWSQAIGITTLTIYDRAGLVKTHWKDLQQILLQEDNCTLVSTVESSIETTVPSRKPITRKSSLLPTPPLSKSNSSISSTQSPPSSPGRRAPETTSSFSNSASRIITLRCLPRSALKPTFQQAESTLLRKRRPSTLLAPIVPDAPGPVTIHLISHELSKAHIASLASQLAREAVHSNRLGREGEYQLTVPQLGALLEDTSLPNGWSRPDLLIVHTPATANLPQKAPLELQGIPPWQIYLTEMTHIPPTRPQSFVLRKLWGAPKSYPGAITEKSFRQALDEYDGAEMRFGK